MTDLEKLLSPPLPPWEHQGTTKLSKDTITKLESGSTNIWTKQLWLQSPYLNTVLYWLHLSVLTRILKEILEVTVIHAST